MKCDNKMTLDEHLKIAKELLEAKKLLFSIRKRIIKHYSLNHPLRKYINKYDPFGTQFSRLTCLLDSEYHRTITTNEFIEHRHIYYNSDENILGINNE